jgi:glutathione S-transferase-like protein
MPVKLHRCPNHWAKLSGHPCWKVEKALDDMGVDFELVPGPFRRKNRDMLDSLSGQRKYPVIQFENGSVYREESRDMERTIRDGRLMERAGGAAAAEPSG